MKTLTELSGTLVRKAAAAIAEAKRSLPTPEAPPAAETPAPDAPAPEAPAEAADAGAATATPPAAAAPASPPARKEPPADEVESETVKAALDAAVAEATGLSGDRLARMRDAVKAAGRQVEDVRLVRVFGPEEPVPGAKSLNGFQYVIDLAPTSMRQQHAPKKERFGGRGGGGRGGGGGGGGKGAPASGGFSMDALREDRKGQRRGPGGPGGGRGKPGGGGPKR
jgi:hypothetical protein